MTVRSIILLLTVPLFLLMAAVNGGLLYFQQKSELSRALGDQALAAAVVTAEFIAEMDDPAGELVQPFRQEALDAAARQVVGLQGIYLVDAGGTAVPLLAGSVDWIPPSDGPGTGARILGPVEASQDGRFLAALAPAGGGRFVAARIDAEPMFAQIDDIKHAIFLIVLAAGIFSAGLSWFVARRIGRELRISRQLLTAIGAGAKASRDDVLQIQETRDLDDAVRLMDASQSAAEVHASRMAARNDRRRGLDEAVGRSQTALFEPVVKDIGGAQVAMRICGETLPGAFFALAGSHAGATAVIGYCTDENPANALAQAMAARHFIEENLLEMGVQECLSLAREAYSIGELEMITWQAGQLPQGDARLLCIADAQAQAGARRYVAANPGAAANEWLEGIEVLLAPSGIFAVVGAPGSANGGQRA